MLTLTTARVLGQIESRKEAIGRSMEHIRHMIAGEDWALAKEYAAGLIVLLEEQTDDSNFAADNMGDET